MKQIPSALNLSCLIGFLDEDHRYKIGFKKRFWNVWNDEIDVKGFLEALGFRNGEGSIARFHEVINVFQESEKDEEAILKAHR